MPSFIPDNMQKGRHKRNSNYYVKYSIIFHRFYTFFLPSKYCLFSLAALLPHIFILIFLYVFNASLLSIFAENYASSSSIQNYDRFKTISLFSYTKMYICSFFKFIWHSKVRHNKTSFDTWVCNIIVNVFVFRLFPLFETFARTWKYNNFLLLNFTYRNTICIKICFFVFFSWETRHFPKAIVIIRNVPTTITKGKEKMKMV